MNDPLHVYQTETSTQHLELNTKFPMIHLSLFIPKIEGKGEDSNPIVDRYKDDSGLVCVFDGLGGSGSKPYTLEGHTYSSAYFASRIAKALTAAYFRTWKRDGRTSMINAITELHRHWKEVSEMAVAKMDNQTSMLRSSLSRKLPTTIAGAYFRQLEGDKVSVDAFWLGDSRVYGLSPSEGLQQLTIDHTKVQKNAMESLYSDGKLEKCLHADNNSRIDLRSVDFIKPVVVIAASDGCFDYVPFPAHFEYIMLETLRDSNSSEEWSEAMKKKFRMASDDVTMGLFALGFQNFELLKSAFKSRHKLLQEEYVTPIEAMETKIAKGEEEEAVLLKERDELRSSLWEKYRVKYEAKLPQGQATDSL